LLTSFFLVDVGDQLKVRLNLRVGLPDFSSKYGKLLIKCECDPHPLTRLKKYKILVNNVSGNSYVH